MKIFFTVIVFLLTLQSNLYSQNKTAYKIFNAKGKSVSYKKLIKSLSTADIVLFGEYHDNPIVHWLQFEVTKDLDENSKLILGAEMLERDNQIYLDKYLNEEIGFAAFDSLSRLWPNYYTDYSPLVDYAKRNNIPFIATNIPRRYARMVFRNGGFSALDSLTETEKSYMTPLPIKFDIELSQYKNMLNMMGDHGSDDIVKAQAIKDATMAYFILESYKNDHTFIHFNGAYHSDFYEGILWYLKQKNNDLVYKTISTVNQEKVKKLNKDNLQRADFIICVDNDMTKTH